MKAAVLFNPDFRPDDPKLAEIGAGLKTFLRGQFVVSHQSYGASFVSFADRMIPVGPGSSGKDYKTALRFAVLEILDEDPDLILTVGGDGLASYVADGVICGREECRRPAMLGIAAGTANVGPVVSFSGARLERVTPGSLATVPVDAVEVLDGPHHAGYAFNDAILGNSLLATVDGETCNISVESLARHGEKVRISPGARIASKGFRVAADGVDVPLPSGTDPEAIRQIIVSSLQFDRLYGRAILGGLCSGVNPGPLAALGLCDRVIVDSRAESWGRKSFTGIQHLLFFPEAAVAVSGLAEDAHIVIDGNPYIRKHDSVTFRCVPGVLRVYREAERGGTDP